MTNIQHASGRLRAWIRDFGHEKQPVFIADLTLVLDECDRVAEAEATITDLKAENKELLERLNDGGELGRFMRL